ncbi:hypothetical protein RhiirA1_543163 [Rhizophagus irregularis]|uniref:Uncharacterized protein n=1 Tax=Rhizophagus irregularis TaxID=588596 RepID=A0A2N0QR54_9GLOM|nr:hypothetical protein RhiirA1_543163 [Rhizophagus irregularis]
MLKKTKVHRKKKTAKSRLCLHLLDMARFLMGTDRSLFIIMFCILETFYQALFILTYLALFKA